MSKTRRKKPSSKLCRLIASRLPTIVFYVILAAIIITRFIEAFFDVRLLWDTPDWLKGPEGL